MTRDTLYEIRVLPGRSRTHLHLLEVAWDPNGRSNPRMLAVESVNDDQVEQTILDMISYCQRQVNDWRRRAALSDPIPGL